MKKTLVVIIFWSLAIKELQARKSLRTLKKPSMELLKIPKSEKVNTAVKKFFQNGPEIWTTVENSVSFLKKVKNIAKTYKTNSGSSLEDWKKIEFMTCQPDQPEKMCYSDCSRKNEKFNWCYTTSQLSDSKWDYCTCQLRPEIKSWILLEKSKLMKKIKTLPKALDSFEIGQWILLGFLTFILMVNCVCLVTKELKTRAIRIQREKALTGTEKEEIPFEPETEEEQKTRKK